MMISVNLEKNKSAYNCENKSGQNSCVCTTLGCECYHFYQVLILNEVVELDVSTAKRSFPSTILCYEGHMC